MRDNCYKVGAKTQSYSVSIKSDTPRQQIAFQETDLYKEKARHRYKIEAKNSELKNVHGYGRATSYGIENMQVQGALAIFTVNLKRIIKLTTWICKTTRPISDPTLCLVSKSSRNNTSKIQG